MAGPKSSKPYSGKPAFNAAASSKQSAVPSASTSKAGGAGASSDESNTTLLISNLPLKYTSDSLSTLLSAVGPIRVAFIVTSQDEEKRSKGFGFAKFVLKEDAEKAIADLNATLIDGKRIGVQWAKRRQRVDRRDQKQPAQEQAPPAFEQAEQTNANVANAYAERRQKKRDAKDAGLDSVAAIDNRKDSRTIILEGGLDTSLPEHKKALQKKLKKLVFGINTGMAALQPADLLITPTHVDAQVYDPTTESLVPASKPVTHLEAPTARSANELSDKLNNSVLKGFLVLSKVKFESDLAGRRGKHNAQGRLIVRNLGFDITEMDLACVFCPFGPIHSIQVHKGYAFVWFVRPDDATAAITAINGKRIYAGMVKDRIDESANHKLTSTKRKEEKGRIVGVRGRIV